MKTINLKIYYPDTYPQDHFIEVTDEVAAALLDAHRYESAYQRRAFWNKAHYSLDRCDGIENTQLSMDSQPDVKYEEKLTHIQLRNAIRDLPCKQRRRIYAHYFLNMTKSEIAQAERVDESSVRESIDSGLCNIKKSLQRNFN